MKNMPDLKHEKVEASSRPCVNLNGMVIHPMISCVPVLSILDEFCEVSLHELSHVSRPGGEWAVKRQVLIRVWQPFCSVTLTAHSTLLQLYASYDLLRFADLIMCAIST